MDIPSSSAVSSSPIPSFKNFKDRFELFILSEAGKPIYTYSKREDAVTVAPLCSALINYALKVQKEALTSIRTSDNLVINFTTRSPLIIILIYEANSFVDPTILVERVESQIISILTAKTLRSVFEERPTFDLKRMLYGSEKLIDSIVNLSSVSPKLQWPWVQAFLAVTSAAPPVNGDEPPLVPSSFPSQLTTPMKPYRVLVPVVTLAPNLRDMIYNILSTTVPNKSKNMVFSLLFRVVLKDDQDGDSDANSSLEDYKSFDSDAYDRPRVDSICSFELITVCNHHSRHKIKIADIHILWALVHGTRSQLSSVESLWMPVCLPRFNQDAFLHSYISYLNRMKYCLVLLSVDRDEFDSCQNSRDKIEEKLQTMLNEPNMQSRINHQVSPLVHPVLLDLQEKLISDKLSGDQLIEAQQQSQIYNSNQELYHARQLQFLWYQTNRRVLWWQRSASKSLSHVLYYLTKKMLQSPLKTLWLKFTDDATFLGWHVPTFQLYAQFDNTISTSEATEVIQRITSWIKKEEDNFSIKDYR